MSHLIAVAFDPLDVWIKNRFHIEYYNMGKFICLHVFYKF